MKINVVKVKDRKECIVTIDIYIYIYIYTYIYINNGFQFQKSAFNDYVDM